MVSGGSKKEGLLETLWALVGCPYLSDLHDYLSDLHDPRYRADVRRAATKLRAEDFSAREWQDALTYLIG